MCKVWKLYGIRNIFFQTPENHDFRKSLNKHIVYAGKLLRRKLFQSFSRSGTSALRAPPGPSGPTPALRAQPRPFGPWLFCSPLALRARGSQNSHGALASALISPPPRGPYSILCARSGHKMSMCSRARRARVHISHLCQRASARGHKCIMAQVQGFIVYISDRAVWDRLTNFTGLLYTVSRLYKARNTLKVSSKLYNVHV